MLQKTLVAAVLSTLCLAATAADYYVVIPTPGRTAASGGELPVETPVETVSVQLNAYTLPSGEAGAAYQGFDFNSVLQVTGDATYNASGVSWSIVSGTLPSGLTLGGTGALSGTPQQGNGNGDTFSLQASYKGIVDVQSYSILIADASAVADVTGLGLKLFNVPGFVGAISAEGAVVGYYTAPGGSPITARNEAAVAWAVYEGSSQLGVLDVGAETDFLVGAGKAFTLMNEGGQYMQLKPVVAAGANPIGAEWTVIAGGPYYTYTDGPQTVGLAFNGVATQVRNDSGGPLSATGTDATCTGGITLSYQSTQVPAGAVCTIVLGGSLGWNMNSMGPH